MIPGKAVAAGCIAALFFAVVAHAADPVPMRVIVPVTDIRSEPKPSDGTYSHDPLQETQLLFGEPVLVHETGGEWVRVSAPGQMEFTHHQVWEGYPGWVKLGDLEIQAPGPAAHVATAKRRLTRLYERPGRYSSLLNSLFPISSSPLAGEVGRGASEARSSETPHPASPSRGEEVITIPMGSRLEILREGKNWFEVRFRDGKSAWIRRRDVVLRPPDVSAYEVRIGVWKTARRWIGTPYYWGGLSPSSGIDCSGLTHLSYRMAGVTIPRDSHEQWMKSEKIRRDDLKRGDLVFLANAAKPDRVVHVMMYVGGEFLIEGPGTGTRVRRVTFKKKFGHRLRQIEWGTQVGEKIVYFGRVPPLTRSSL
ncbi:C40 family peptidase [bacterium]|nr:C40 family peptidase [bacterium]